MLRKLNKFFVGLILLLSVSVVQASATQEQKNAGPVFDNPTKPILVGRDQDSFTLTLKSNPSTGYSWFLSYYNSAILVPAKHQYTPAGKSTPGAPGYEVWKFNVNEDASKVPQVTEIELVYARPWEIVDSQAEKFTIVIK